MKLVSNKRRFFALIIDLAVVEFIITKPLSGILNESFSEGFSFSAFDFGTDFFLISFFIGVLSILYWTILEYNIGQTLGGMILKIKMRNDNSRLGLGFFQVLLRNLSKFSVLLLLIDSFGIFLNNKKQRFLESLSKTVTMEDF